MYDSAFTPPDRRCHIRHAVQRRVTIVLGRDTLVFGKTLDISEGGACIVRPARFTVQLGERLAIAFEQRSKTRDVRVVNVAGCRVHCAFA